MHAHAAPPPFVVTQQQQQQLYWYSYLEIKFTKHREPRSPDGRAHYPYKTFQHCHVQFKRTTSPKTAV